MMGRKTAWIACAWVLASGCKDGIGPAASITIVDGLNQYAKVGEPLTNRLAVRVFKGDFQAAEGVTIDWTVEQGGGTVSPASVKTGTGGEAQALYTAGATAGTHIIRASAKDAGLAATFTVGVGAAPQPVLVAEIPTTPLVHDTFVRDGLVFVCAWNTGGLKIYDVGNGIAGGTPASPQLVSTLIIPNLMTSGTQIHNAWWFWNPNTGEKRYLFLGEETAGVVGQSSSGDIHVVDVSDLAHPQKVATYHMGGTTRPAGAHNFWMDEQDEVLFAAFYNGGVVALDVSGTLSGDLAGREIARINPVGTSPTYVWGVQLVNGSLYVADFLNGLIQLKFDGSGFTVAGGGFNVTERYTSDLWVHDSWGYTGTYGGFARAGKIGDVVKVWQLSATGAPALVDSLVFGSIQTVSDIQVTADGKVLVFSAERGTSPGLYFFSLVPDPRKPQFLTRIPLGNGVHTATVADIGGRRYVFAARNSFSGPPPTPSALQIWDMTAMAPP